MFIFNIFFKEILIFKIRVNILKKEISKLNCLVEEQLWS